MDVVRRFSFRALVAAIPVLIIVCAASVAVAAPVVPGTGEVAVKDDFEDATWKWVPQGPKSSSNIDDQVRDPAGASSNGRWQESRLRGEPDVIRRIDTPPGGIPGSKGALFLQTLRSGVPGRRTNKFQQDDLLMDAGMTTGGYIPVSWTPSVVVRVFMPPFENWEKRTGATFALRTDVTGTFEKPATRRVGFFGRSMRSTRKEVESFWPGIFVQFNSKTDGQNTEDSAMFLIRADNNGHDITGPIIKQTGWWTIGMSFTGDGMAHYYASPGVDPLTPADHIASSVPYGTRIENFNTLFFNVVNQDDGKSWSTEWVVDDPAIYWIRR
ncbi:MAG: hypothetical protein AB7O26_17125 [Planctomycetaceae bacterium]